jgi:hypothetical protein
MATGPSRAAGPMFPECPQELICFSSLLSCFHHPSTSRGFEFAASVNIRGRGSSRAAVAGRRSLWSNPRIERAGVLPFFDRRANPITDDHRHVRYSRTSASSLIRAWPGLTVGSAGCPESCSARQLHRRPCRLLSRQSLRTSSPHIDILIYTTPKNAGLCVLVREAYHCIRLIDY